MAVRTSHMKEVYVSNRDQLNSGLTGQILPAFEDQVSVFQAYTAAYAGDDHYIGGLTIALNTATPLIVGGCGIGTPAASRFSDPRPFGAVEISEISVLSNAAIADGGAGTLPAYFQHYACYSDNGGTTSLVWGDNGRLLSGTTAEVTFNTRQDAGATTHRFDIMTVSNELVLETGAAIAKTQMTLVKPLVLRAGDLLTMTTGAAAVTAGTSTITIIVKWRKLSPQAIFRGCGERLVV